MTNPDSHLHSVGVAGSEHEAQAHPIGPVLRRFFAALDAGGIEWAVLRGGEGLPDETRYDVDLMVRPEAINRGEALLREAAAGEGWAVVRIIDKFRYRCCLLISPGPARRYLPVDFFGGCHHRFYPIANWEAGLAGRERSPGGVYLVRPGFGAAVSLLKELTRHPVFKENSRAEVAAGARADGEAFRQAVGGILGGPLTERLLAACGAERWDEVEAMAPELRRQVHAGRSRMSGAALDFFAGNVRHHLFPRMSCLVVLLGPDGCGKSTIADAVAEELYHRPFKVCRRFEYQFRILPELKHLKRRLLRLAGRAAPPPPPAAVPGTPGSGMNPDHGTARGMLYVTYYALDFLLGRLLLRKLRGQGALLLFARYYHDYYFQRGYGNVPRWYLRALECLVPRPDLILALQREADEIHHGKPELSIEEIRRQQDLIGRMLAGRPDAAIIDASRGVASTIHEVCARIEGFLLSQHSIE